MWNLLLTAAIAGSTGFIAKHVFTNYHTPPECEQEKNLQEHPAFESPPGTKECHGYESNCDQEGIFRFSSSAAGSRRRNKKKSSLKEKPGVLCRRLKFATENVNRSGGLKGISGRKLCACSKKKRTESSLFGRGLDVGIMYMMSAGKAEIKSPNDMELCGLTVVADDVECPSSVLTEEPEPAVLEMDQLEAELESELQKLPWSSTETSGHDATRLKFGKAEVSSEGFCELEGANDVSYQCSGVMPSELDNKLCHLLIEQQENQITGLESELNLAQSQLHEKEAELEALKDCVRRLTEFSLSNISDDEDEVQPELECNTEWDKNSQTGSESRKSVVGMKRPIDSA
ncbi:POLAR LOCALIZATION DURING ASYMMETRIC DIVISION AND PROTEIN [Salix purpurea]|uniref:POLAR LOCALIZATION DURING ASYMMETRIC DIVISION AND PROTEIN n=1 Tax=Salix purpurea TaxID=77065 RepID=A0A9Q0Q325_SALPP|nr:POLAR LOCALIZATION DURING ASYMMETRIC DIVISION AND PROTEIN [Salix purpurea]